MFTVPSQEEEPMESDSEKKGERKILSQTTWLLYSAALFAIVLVPAFTGLFYMIRFTESLFQEKVEYSVLIGMAVGIILSLVAGYFYSNMARKHVE
jgi:xanthine/uracil permease